jgi:TIR domain
VLGWSVSAGLTASHQPRGLRYDGFIACSERDASWAEQLAERLERYYAVRPLMPRQHFFRASSKDNRDYALAESTISALDASRSLIVLCSPTAAQCHHVNEEIRLFKSHHPNRPVIPLIVDGKPGDEDSDCFPPLLKFELDAEGCITNGPVNVKATDAREWAGGHARGASRIVSDLLGLPYKDGDLRSPRRPRSAERLGNMLNFGLAAGLGTLMIWQGLNTDQHFADRTLHLVTSGVTEVANKAVAYGASHHTVVGLLERGERVLTNFMTSAPRTAKGEYFEASMLLGFARTYQSLGDRERALLRADEAARALSEARDKGGKDAELQRRTLIVEEELADLRSAQEVSRTP